MALAILPVAEIAWVTGVRGGLLVSALSLPFNILRQYFHTHPEWKVGYLVLCRAGTDDA